VTAAAAAAAAGEGGAGSSGRGRGRRAAAAGAAAAVTAAAGAEAGGGSGKGKSGGKGNGGGGSRAASRAISETGHTCRGRVRQKSHKTTELVQVGSLRAGGRAYTPFLVLAAVSMVSLDSVSMHHRQVSMHLRST
jgi:hypothetical protein